MKIRGFEKVAKYADIDFPMPERKTELSAVSYTHLRAHETR